MTPLYLAVLALVLLWSLAGYALRRAPVSDVRRVLQVGTLAVVVLALGALGVLLVNPADVPSVLRAVLGRY